MTKVILIDDEPLSREIIKSYLASYKNLLVVAECNDGFEGVKAIMQHQPDLIFLDIQMPKINGFEMLELVEQPPAVIFTTAFDEYAIRAFEANAVDYLLKPFSEDRFRKAVDKFLEKSSANSKDETNTLLESVASSPNQAERIVVRTGNKVKIIPTHDIHYLEADDDYVKIVTQEGSFLKNRTMQFYEKTLDPNFFVRVHRSYIVHVNQITRIDPYQKETHLAVLRDGKQIPVSKSGYGKLKEILGL
ncbi:MAG TPA: LytTR family DNA-binding domain-containing protein [Cyclobacteriaceae bacterium]|nr:LytTR family DNA-binding domain-containing protein [Cyclobacteriaceae bacterium]